MNLTLFIDGKSHVFIFLILFAFCDKNGDF